MGRAQNALANRHLYAIPLAASCVGINKPLGFPSDLKFSLI